VLDAGTLEVRKNRGGDIIGLDIIDGSTIKVLIDTTGRRPAPPAPAFEQIIHGRPWVLTEDGRVNTNTKGRPVFADQLIYVPRNPRPHKLYGYSAVEQIMLTITSASAGRLCSCSTSRTAMFRQGWWLAQRIGVRIRPRNTRNGSTHSSPFGTLAPRVPG
jgi:hypothetical protein